MEMEMESLPKRVSSSSTPSQLLSLKSAGVKDKCFTLIPTVSLKTCDFIIFGLYPSEQDLHSDLKTYFYTFVLNCLIAASSAAGKAPSTGCKMS